MGNGSLDFYHFLGKEEGETEGFNLFLDGSIWKKSGKLESDEYRAHSAKRLGVIFFFGRWEGGRQKEVWEEASEKRQGKGKKKASGVGESG